MKKTPAARLAFAWYVTGNVLAALVIAGRERSWAPVASALAGVREIFTDYAGSAFLASGATSAAAAPSEASPRRMADVRGGGS